METCLKYLKYNYFSKTIKCNSQPRKVLNKVTKQTTFQLFKRLMILYKQGCTIMRKESEIKVKGRNKIVIKKEFIIDLPRPLFQCLVKVIQLLILWTLFKTTQMYRLEPLKITIIPLFLPMEIRTLENMRLQVISFKVRYKMVLG